MSKFAFPSLNHAGGQIPDREVVRRVDEQLRMLRQAEVRPGQIVAAPVDTPLALVLLRFALERLQAGLLPLPPEWRAQDLPLESWGIEWLWRDGGVAPLHQAETAAAGDIGLLVATSGSVGRPKGVMFAERALHAAAERVNTVLTLETGDCWLACLPLYHIGGLAIVERCRLSGAALWLEPRFDTRAVAAALATGRVTHISLVPAMLWRLLETGIRPPASLRVVLIGGQALAPALAQRALAQGWPLYVSYGATETGGMITCDSGSEAGLQEGQVGRPLPGVEVKVAEGGGLAMRGPVLMSGYANALRASGDGLVEGWFVSEDLGSVSEHGVLRVRGRRDDMLVSGGVNIQPAQIEAQLAGVPGLGEVAVSGKSDPVWGARLILFYTGTMSSEEAEAVCRERLSGAQRPRRAVRIDELPRRGPGKLDRRRLADAWP